MTTESPEPWPPLRVGIPLCLSTTLHQHVNLPTSITAHKQPSLAIPRQPHRPEAVTWAFRLVGIVEDVFVGGIAVGRSDGLAVGKVDDGDFVAGGVATIPERRFGLVSW